MFGLKNSEKILGMLKLFGIDMKTIIPQAEKMICSEWQKWENEAGCRLIAVAERGNAENFEIALFKDIGAGNLSLWRKFDLNNLAEFLNNTQKNTENVHELTHGGSSETTTLNRGTETKQGDGETGSGQSLPFYDYPAFQ